MNITLDELRARRSQLIATSHRQRKELFASLKYLEKEISYSDSLIPSGDFLGTQKGFFRRLIESYAMKKLGKWPRRAWTLFQVARSVRDAFFEKKHH
jgi:hypothetical protein